MANNLGIHHFVIFFDFDHMFSYHKISSLLLEFRIQDIFHCTIHLSLDIIFRQDKHQVHIIYHLLVFSRKEDKLHTFHFQATFLYLYIHWADSSFHLLLF